MNAAGVERFEGAGKFLAYAFMVSERLMYAGIAKCAWQSDDVCEPGNYGEAQHAALHAYSMCWIGAFAKLHYSVGLNPAIDAANASCKRQFEAFAVATARMEVGEAMIGVIRAAKDSGLDNVKS